MFGERHLRHLLRSYATYYSAAGDFLVLLEEKPSIPCKYAAADTGLTERPRRDAGRKHGTFETFQTARKMSGYWGRPEVIGARRD